MAAAMTPEVWDQLKHLREDREKLKEAAESALQDGDEGGFEFQNMLASEITEKIEELEGKYGTQPPLPGARNEPSQVPQVGKLPLPPPPPAPVASVALAKLPGMPGALPGVANLPPGLAATIPPGVAANLPPGIAANIPPGVASALGKMPPVPGAPPMPGLAPGFAGVRPPPFPLPPGVMPPLLGQPANLTQQQAMEYEETKARDTALEPEVIELVHYFKISDRHARMLNEQLKRRNNTYEEDIASLYEILKGAKNPGDLLMVSIRWMEKGVFRGTLTPNPAVEKAAKKYKLDAPSACKLAEVLECREDPDADLRRDSLGEERGFETCIVSGNAQASDSEPKHRGAECVMKMSHEERSLCLVDQPKYGGETRTEGCCADQRKLNVNVAHVGTRCETARASTCHKHEAHFSPRLAGSKASRSWLASTNILAQACQDMKQNTSAGKHLQVSFWEACQMLERNATSFHSRSNAEFTV